MIKCIGCYDLLREELDLGGKLLGKHLVVYICPRFFQHPCALSGLIRPGKGTIDAAKECPDNPREQCILCHETELLRYGVSEVGICKEHDKAWSKWLDDHPGKRDQIAPHGRARRDKWIEVFREFIEANRPKKDT